MIEAAALVAVVACFVVGGYVVVAALMRLRRQPVTELRETLAILPSVLPADLREGLERIGWQVTEQQVATGRLDCSGPDLDIGMRTVVEAPKGGDGAGTLLFIHRRTASTAPCLLRISLRRTPEGGVADLAMRGWGDGFINRWVLRRRLRSAVHCLARLSERDAFPVNATGRMDER